MFVPFTVANFKNNEKIKATAHNTLTNRLAGTTTSTITVSPGQNGHNFASSTDIAISNSTATNITTY